MKTSLLVANDSRDEARDSDSWGTNVLLDAEVPATATKRPGLTQTYDGTSPGQGVFIWPGYPDYPGEPKVISIADDVFNQISPVDWSLEFFWDMDSIEFSSTLPYDSGTSYTLGARVSYTIGSIVSDEETADENTVWYCMYPISGIAPASSYAAFPYWSRYPYKPSGSHPVMYPTWNNVTIPPSPGIGDPYVVQSRFTVYGNARGYSATYSGTANHVGGFPSPGDVTNTYNNFTSSPSWLLTNGYDVAPSVSYETFSEYALIAAQDYQRSHLGI